MDILLGFCFGFVLGCGLIKLVSSIKPMGSLYAYKSDVDNQTYLYLELFENVDTVCEKNQVVFEVNKSFITQK